ncbi:SAM-dependent methyltransferase, partial [Lysobacter sp. 2RAB21]
TRAELRAMAEAGFAFEVFGSFTSWLSRDDDTAPRPPGDADLLLPDDQGRFDALLHWLHARNYELTLWSEAVLPPVSLERLRAHWYLRAQRRDRLGRLVRLDLCLDASG